MDNLPLFRKEAYRLLKQYWGYEDFRPRQLSIMEAVVEGKDVIAVLPTGGGKSLCYQLPALYLPGGALVISPLIALMNDQVAWARKRGIPAVALHSGMDASILEQALERMSAGMYKLVYVSPERLRSTRFLEALAGWKFSFLAVDEAHCISQWGHEFRPAYLEIVHIRQAYSRVPVMAVTATATRQVREDIIRLLDLHHPFEVIGSFSRANIHYAVVRTEDKLHALLQIIKAKPGSKLVYCRDRRTTVQVARWLSEQGIPAAAYHAGLSYEEREQRQQAWLTGNADNMVCTNAFGMGIHKDDVRVVVHYHMPESLEAYFQETGRAGRDGLPAQATVLVGLHDLDQLQTWVMSRYPDLETVRQVFASLMNYLQIPAGTGGGRAFDFYLPDFCQRFGYRPVVVQAVLRILEWEGWLYRTDAVVHPSVARFQISRSDLLALQQIYPLEALVAEILLRLYPGIADVPVAIDEGEIARHAGASRMQVSDVLMHMHQMGWIVYKASYESPQLLLLADRPPAAALFLKAEHIYFLKERALERLKQVRQYLDATSCRMQIAADYFGEQAHDPCNHCDLCEQSISAHSGSARLENIMLRILELLHKPCTSDEIYRALPDIDRKRVRQVIDHLLAEAYISMDPSGRLWVYNSSSRSNMRMAD